MIACLTSHDQFIPGTLKLKTECILNTVGSLDFKGRELFNGHSNWFSSDFLKLLKCENDTCEQWFKHEQKVITPTWIVLLGKMR